MTPDNEYEIVHIPELRRIDSRAPRADPAVLGRYSYGLTTGWYLVIRPTFRTRRGARLAEYLGPFESGSDAGAAIAAIDARFASHA